MNQDKKRGNNRFPSIVTPLELLEAATGVEPVNNGFADRCLSHLAMPPLRLSYAAIRLSCAAIRLSCAALTALKADKRDNPLCFVERETGFEPAATTLATWCSTN